MAKGRRAGLVGAKIKRMPIIAANAFLPGDLKCVGPNVDSDALMHYGAVAFARAQQVGIRTVCPTADARELLHEAVLSCQVPGR